MKELPSEIAALAGLDDIRQCEFDAVETTDQGSRAGSPGAKPRMCCKSRSVTACPLCAELELQRERDRTTPGYVLGTKCNWIPASDQTQEPISVHYSVLHSTHRDVHL